MDASVIKRIAAAVCLTGFGFITNAQDNSPYSRYGLGDEISSSNATSRGMGGVSAAYNSYTSVNYANPASYAYFLSIPEPGTRKQLQGRTILDIGIEGTGHTLIDKSQQSRFTSSNLIFNRISLGVPLRRNWGMALSLRPLNRISYKIQNVSGPLRDETTGKAIDSATTVFQGSGGTYLASLGTGVKFALAKSHYISLGINGGYLFGSKDYARHRTLYNDSTAYALGTWDSKTSMGGIYADAGLQYQGKMSDKLYLGIGVYGNWQQKINTNVAYTSTATNNTTGAVQIVDSSGFKSTLTYPTNLTAGFILQKAQSQNEAGWLLGADFTTTNWQNYRENNLPDTAVASNWKLKIGAEFSPVTKKNYLSQMYYRIGFFTGPDYIKLRGAQLPLYGITAGVGLPLANYNQQARGQATMINLGLEYIKRGNSNSPLQENMYRVTLGFSLTDMWFGKRRNGDR